jgi:hypothetical protein
MEDLPGQLLFKDTVSQISGGALALIVPPLVFKSQKIKKAATDPRDSGISAASC